MDKKKTQLGMNPSTASHRLVKDILFKFVQEAGHTCHQCAGELTRDTFSVEHKEPWLDSADPQGLYFNLDNIAFSHLSCNSKAARRDKLPCGTLASYNRGCRCDECRPCNAESKRKYYSTEKRKERYLKHERKDNLG